MEKYRNFSLFIILILTPDFPHFYYILGGNLGSLLSGDVSVITITSCCKQDKDHKPTKTKSQSQDYTQTTFFIIITYKIYRLKLCTHDQDLRIRKFCIYANFAYVSKSIFLLCVHMAFKDQQNLSEVEILFYKSTCNSYFLELRKCLYIIIWILQVSKLLLGESTYVTMHML